MQINLQFSEREYLRGEASEIRLSEQKTKFLFGISLDLHYLCSRNHINKEIMEASTQHFTAQDWAEHAQFVQMFRAAKQRKREWQAKMEATLAEKAEKIRRRREEIDKLFEK